MKKHILILWSCIICLLGCSKSNEEDLPSPTLEINAPSEIVFKADATCPNSIITVTTNQSSWIYSLNPYDGAGWLSAQQSGNILKLTAKKNDQPEERKRFLLQYLQAKPKIFAFPQDNWLNNYRMIYL